MTLRVAVVAVGVVAAGTRGDGCPGFAECVTELGHRFDVTVYSLLPVDPARVPVDITVRSLRFRTGALATDLFCLFGMLLVDHLRRRFDVVHAVAAYPIGWVVLRLCRRVLRAPCVVALQGQELANFAEVDFGDLRDATRKARIARTCREADTLTAMTRTQARGLTAVGVAPDAARIIPLGVDTRRFGPEAKPLAEPYVFLHVSHAHPVKDLAMLADTFRLIRNEIDARLLIVGDGHLGGATEGLLRERGLAADVCIVGGVERVRMAEHYRRAHFLLQTSRFESQGIVFSEAMTAGVVVCSTRVGLAADLGDDYCVTAEPGDARALARAALGLIRQPLRHAALKANGRRWSVAHDVGWSADRYAEIYAELAGRSPPPKIRS